MANKYKSEIELKGDVTDVKKKLDEVNKKLNGLGEQSKKQSKNTTTSFAKIGIAVAAVGVAATKMWNQFIEPASQLQSQMANVSTLIDTSKVSINALTESVHNLSLEVPKSAPELAAGLYQVVSAGVDAGKQLEVVELSAKGATAGISSTTEALNLGAAVIKAYNKGWDEFESIQDQAFKTVELGQTTYGELAQNIQKNTAQSNQLKFATDELFGSYATLTGVTGNTAEVSTQLRGIMTGLIRPKKELIALAKEQGYATVEEMAQTEGFIGVLEILKDATGGSAAEMGKMFESQEALTALGALLTTQYDTLVEKTDMITDSTGAMNAAFEKQMGTWENQVKILSNHFKPALVGVMTALTGMVKSVNEYLETPLSESIEKQRVNLNNMVFAITSVNDNEKVRLELIKDLQGVYPDFLKNIDAEKVSNDLLLDKLVKVNEELKNKAILAILEERQAKAFAKSGMKYVEQKAAVNSFSNVMSEFEKVLGVTIDREASIADQAKLAKEEFIEWKKVHDVWEEGWDEGSVLLGELWVKMRAYNKAVEEGVEADAKAAEMTEELAAAKNKLNEAMAGTDGEGSVPPPPPPPPDETLTAYDAWIEKQQKAVELQKQQVEWVNKLKEDYPELAKSLGLIKIPADEVAYSMEIFKKNIDESITSMVYQSSQITSTKDAMKAAGQAAGQAASGFVSGEVMKAVSIWIRKFLQTTPLPPYISAPLAIAGGTAFGSLMGSAVKRNFFAKGGVLSEPVFSPLMKGGAIAGEAGREAIIPLDRKDGIFGQMNEELKGLREAVAENSGVTVNVSAPLVDETVIDNIIPAIEKAKRLDLA